LNSGAKPLIEIEPSIIDGYLIALKEYEQKKIPFIIKRPIPNGGIEYWKFEDLEMID
jgi:DNA-directed RNA polymerase subunit K/omega